MEYDEVEDLQAKIRQLRDELKVHGEEVDDPNCSVLCETSTEVLTGLEVAFDHYLNKKTARA
jgi:hypothetical protein